MKPLTKRGQFEKEYKKRVTRKVKARKRPFKAVKTQIVIRGWNGKPTQFREVTQPPIYKAVFEGLVQS